MVDNVNKKTPGFPRRPVETTPYTTPATRGGVAPGPASRPRLEKIRAWLRQATHTPVVSTPQSRRLGEVRDALLQTPIVSRDVIGIVQDYCEARPVKLADVDLTKFDAFRLNWMNRFPDHRNWSPHTRVLVVHESDPEHARAATYAGGVIPFSPRSGDFTEAIYVHGAWNPKDLGWKHGVFKVTNHLRRTNPDGTCLMALRRDSNVSLYVLKSDLKGLTRNIPAVDKDKPWPCGTPLTLTVCTKFTGVGGPAIGKRQVPCTLVSVTLETMQVKFQKLPETVQLVGSYPICGLERFAGQHGANREYLDTNCLDNYFDGAQPWTSSPWKNVISSATAPRLCEEIVGSDEYDGQKYTISRSTEEGQTNLCFPPESVLARKFTPAPATQEWDIPLKERDGKQAARDGDSGQRRMNPGTCANRTDAIPMDAPRGRPMTKDQALSLEKDHPTPIPPGAMDNKESRLPVGTSQPLTAPSDDKRGQAPGDLSICKVTGSASWLEQAFSDYYRSATSALDRSAPPAIKLDLPQGGQCEVHVTDLGVSEQGRLVATIERSDSLEPLPDPWKADGSYKVLLDFRL